MPITPSPATPAMLVVRLQIAAAAFISAMAIAAMLTPAPAQSSLPPVQVETTSKGKAKTVAKADNPASADQPQLDLGPVANAADGSLTSSKIRRRRRSQAQ